MITIVSSRKIQANTSSQIIYEWEDEFCEAFNLPLKQLSTVAKTFVEKLYFHKGFFPLVPRTPKADYKLFFSMVAPFEYNFFSMPDYIPLIVDAWRPDLWRIEKFCKFNKFIFLGCLEAVEALTKKGLTNVYYSPVSISQKWQCIQYPEKDIDLLVYGRNHEIMWDWITAVSNSKLHIVMCYPNKEKEYIANSNKKGIIGKVYNREDLMLLLKKSKYSAVSSTGNDKRNKVNAAYTGGFSPVTPRFLECVVNYCQGIGIWYSNPDFNYFGIDDVSIKAESFSQFEDSINKDPDREAIKYKFDNFIDSHWTFRRMQQIRKVVG